jgi:molybdopterin converting factor subunit 1
MHITVKLFALLREKAGTDTLHVQVPDNATVSQALEVLRQQHAVLAPYLTNVRLSLHMEFVTAETVLSAGDEVALIPPVSGGR